MRFGFPGDLPDYHAYEALQIFFSADKMPEFVPGEASTWLEYNGKRYVIPEFSSHKELERHIYKLVGSLTGLSSPWGCLTGVRPTKIVNTLFASGLDRDQVLGELTGFYLADRDKAELALKTAELQRPFLDLQMREPERIGVYIGIPFCPTRCVYCSFTSNSIEKYRKSLDKYMELMYAEMADCAMLIKERGLKVESVYLGGGTPTSLPEPLFEEYIRNVVSCFIDPSPELREFAVEAGRPDSITSGKLDICKSAGVTRISVNPQTMNDETLKLIGRHHTSEQTLKAFELSRKCGFDNINMDIIAGLPGETPEMFEHTLDQIEALGPESVTVHTLSVKRAAELRWDNERRGLLSPEYAGTMVSSAASRLTARGMRPYYMYRQKNMLGNHENAAYCVPGKESPYNIHIMEEDQTILACGAGGVSKRVYGGNILRAFNVKSVEEYLARSGEMAERKRKLFE